MTTANILGWLLAALSVIAGLGWMIHHDGLYLTLKALALTAVTCGIVALIVLLIMSD